MWLYVCVCVCTSIAAVQTLHVPPSAWKGYHGAVFDLASQGVDLAWQTSDLPATHKFIAASYQLLTSSLPLNVLQELLRFTQDPTAPCALLITGLPADSDVPATPTGRKGVKQNENMDIRVPVMESVILGTAKLLGNPMMAASIAKGNRGGLVSDLVGVTEVTYTHKVSQLCCVLTCARAAYECSRIHVDGPAALLHAQICSTMLACCRAIRVLRTHGCR